MIALIAGAIGIAAGLYLFSGPVHVAARALPVAHEDASNSALARTERPAFHPDPPNLAHIVPPSSPSPSMPSPSPTRVEEDGPEQYEKQVIKQVTSSGKATEDWTFTFERDIAKWEASADLKGVSLGRWSCYRGGCLTEATYDDGTAMTTFDHLFAESEPFKDWPGSKLKTAPFYGDKQVKATWVFLRPSP